MTPCTAKKTFEAAARTGAHLLVQVKENQPTLLQHLRGAAAVNIPLDANETMEPVRRNRAETRHASRDCTTSRSPSKQSPKVRLVGKGMHSGTLRCRRGPSTPTFKNHVNVDCQHKLIRRYHVSDAALYDSQAVDPLLTQSNTGSGVWADSAYRSEAMEEKLRGLNPRPA